MSRVKTNKRARRRSSARRQAAAPPRRKLPLAWILGGVVAAAVLAAMALTFGGATDRRAEFGDPQLQGPALAPYIGGEDGAVGQPIPEVDGADFDGTAISIRRDGKAKAIVFLAHWCPHCRAEVPRVQAWLDAGGGVDGIEIVSVATASSEIRPNYPPSVWLESEGWSPHVVVDSEDSLIYHAFGGGAFPYWVFVDADGYVAARSSGEMPIDVLQLFLEGTAAA